MQDVLAGGLERLVGGEARFEGEDRVDRVVREQHAQLGRVGVELQRLVLGGDEPEGADRLDAGAVERGDGGLGEEVFKRLLFRGSGEAVGAKLEELPRLRGLVGAGPFRSRQSYRRCRRGGQKLSSLHGSSPPHRDWKKGRRVKLLSPTAIAQADGACGSLAIGPFRRLTARLPGPKLCLSPQPHRVRHELRPPALATPARHPGSGRPPGRRIAPSLHPRRVGSFPSITRRVVAPMIGSVRAGE